MKISWCFGLMSLLMAGMEVQGDASPLTALTPTERLEVQSRILKFYAPSGEDSAMDVNVPKFDARTGSTTTLNAKLRGNVGLDSDALVRGAGLKADSRYRVSWCREFLKPHFPEIRCDEAELSWETAPPEESVMRITQSWMADSEVIQSLDRLPVSAEAAPSYWSGDYWRMRWGLTSYRYSERRYFDTYDDAVSAYQQPSAWLSILAPFEPMRIAAIVLNWSPAEKYDLLVGDEDMTLTQQQKREGSWHVGADGNVESWFGLCHGWAPASFMVAAPTRSITAVGARGVPITFYPDDVRALATLAWSNGRYSTNFIGGRCNAKETTRYPNGRLSQPECFDNNPASFHLALGNLLGRRGTPFIMDAAFDYEVWNQPIVAYHFEYFNPLSPADRGPEWKPLSVSYDEAFKRADRFQSPLTRGIRRSAENYDDSEVRRIVGVAATIVYLAEVSATHQPTASRNATVRVTYTYDLELEEKDGVFIATGGEWHENTHPDFLWVPSFGSVALRSYDEATVAVDLTRTPTEETGRQAQVASGAGYPLCQVLRAIVNQASGTENYRCLP